MVANQKAANALALENQKKNLSELLKKQPDPKIPSLLAPTKDAPAYYVGGK
jgi:hypothetical protein